MSERTIWTCDGCDDELVLGKNTTSDWRRITVSLSGFSGYPVGDLGNGEKTFELCPSCQKWVHQSANPKAWPRELKQAPIT